MSNKEIWKNISGYEKLYQISNFGNVKSLPKKRKGPNWIKITDEIILKQSIDKWGYHAVKLTKNGNSKFHLVHRLVLYAFVGKENKGQETLHLDDNTHNNNINNLKWGTKSENIKQMHAHGRKNMKGEESPAAKLTKAQVDRIHFLKGKVEKGYWTKLARALGVHPSTIHHIVNGNRWRHV